MSNEELILKAVDKCLEKAEGERRRLFVWMKAALQFPGLNQFMEEVKRTACSHILPYSTHRSKMKKV